MQQKTALITGASSGIGYELAWLLAKHGYQLVLVARSKEKLRQLVDQIKSQYPKLAVHYVATDLTLPAGIYEVKEFCNQQALQIDCLINNAGIGQVAPFCNSNWDMQQQMLDLNVKALVQLTHVFLPPMVQRNNGHVANIASTAAFQPGPYMSLYYASKAFVVSFSKAIRYELKHTGVSVTAICPGPTESNFHAVSGNNNTRLIQLQKMPSSKQLAEFTFKAMQQNKAVAIQGWMNKIVAFFSTHLPDALVLPIVAFLQKPRN